MTVPFEKVVCVVQFGDIQFHLFSDVLVLHCWFQYYDDS